MVQSRMISTLTEISATYIPSLGEALFIFLGGVLLGEILKKLVKKSFDYSHFNKTLKRLKLSANLAGMPIDTLVPEVVKWYIVIVFLSQALTTLNLSDVNVVVNQVRDFIPLIAKVGLTIYIGILIGEYLREEIQKSGVPQGNIAGLLVYGAAIYLAAAMGLAELYPQGMMVLNIVLAVTLSAIGFGIALGVGLAVGLGTKDIVAKFAKQYVKSK